MSHPPRFKLFAALLIAGALSALALPAQAQETATVTGVITDAENGESLPGATAELRNLAADTMHQGDITDSDSRYTLQNIPAGQYLLVVRFAGYNEHVTQLSLAVGETQVVNVALRPTIVQSEIDIVVTGEAWTVKKTEALAAVTSISAEEIQADVSSSSSDVLRKVPGLDMARTGVDRREVVVRGFGKTFTGATYVMTDYRQSAVASLGVNAYNMMPISSIDLDRIEVVRGPAGALYGPGVDEGAIHFITKSAFQKGTTVALSGGERSMFQGELRHAGIVNNQFGYKISAQYLQAEEWRLDPSDPHDADLIARYYSIIPFDRDVTKVVVTGTAEYNFSDDKTTLTATGGYASAKSPFLSDIGPLQSDGFGYRFGQLRLSSGRFFAQAYLNANDAGNSFIYAGPQVPRSLSGETVVDNSTQLNLQAQYGLHLVDGKEEVTFGADFEQTNPSTDGTINGRNELDDRIMEYGVYGQSLTRLSRKFKLTLAGRLDYDNVFEKLQLSPRAAIVYNPTEEHAIRATFNRAIASPGTNSLFLDIMAAESPLPVRARGAAHGFTFEHNSDYLAFASSDLVASSLNPAFLGQPQPAGLQLDPIYGAIYDELSGIPIPVLTQILCDNGICLTEQEVAYIVGELSPDQTQVTGFSDGSLGLLDLTTGAVNPVSGAPDIAPLEQSTTQTFEIGYNGPIFPGVRLSVDAYYSIKENFIRGLQLETPFVFVPQLSPDLTAAINSGVRNNEELCAALTARGIPCGIVGGLIMNLASESLPGPTTPVALVQPSENNPGVGQSPELLMTYRNFGRVSVYGLEAAVDVEVSKGTDVYGSLSWVSDDFFDHEELDEENEDLFVSLNAPTFKAAVGASHRMPKSFSFLVGGRYVQGFTVRTGPYNGFVDDYFLLDLGAGYDFGSYAPGLRLDVTVQNVLDHMHREFVGAPKMGRLGLARLTYTF